MITKASDIIYRTSDIVPDPVVARRLRDPERLRGALPARGAGEGGLRTRQGVRRLRVRRSRTAQSRRGAARECGCAIRAGPPGRRAAGGYAHPESRRAGDGGEIANGMAVDVQHVAAAEGLRSGEVSAALNSPGKFCVAAVTTKKRTPSNIVARMLIRMDWEGGGSQLHKGVNRGLPRRRQQCSEIT